MRTGRLAFLLLLLAACNDDSPSPEDGTTIVRFVYAAATTIDPAVAAQFPSCVQGVGQTHIHSGWRGFSRVDMSATPPDRWEITFEDVPVGIENRIRVSDPNVCAESSTGAATRGVSANGVTLVRIVDTPGSGTEPGFAFTVAADGSVTP